MAHAVKSGNMFTMNPIKNSKSEIYAQVIWGINNNMMTNPSVFVFDKQSRAVVEQKEVQQEHYYTKQGQFGELLAETLPSHLGQTALLSENERAALAELAAKIERVMNFPQYIEWAVERNTIQVVQTQPITNIFTKPLISSDKGVLISSLTGAGQAVLVSGKEDLSRVSQGRKQRQRSYGRIQGRCCDAVQP